LWKDRIEAGYCHDFELFSRWREEPQTVTKYPSVNFNAQTSGQQEFLERIAKARAKEVGRTTEKDALKYRLSILIPSLEARKEMRERLIKSIETQCSLLEDKESSIEIIVEIDSGEKTVGEKRNFLLEKAKGDYVVFIDDDDEVADSYVTDILDALKQNPDCVTFRGQITSEPPEEFRFDIYYPHNIWAKDSNGVHMRCPSSLCPIRSTIAKSVKFKPISCAEDRIWAIELYPLLQSQVYIDKLMYIYHASADTTEAQKEKRISESRAIVDNFRYTPFIRNRRT
jgi:glycosyltransferase involved in cell wall biosynthesis